MSAIITDRFDYQSIVQESKTALAPALSVGLGVTGKVTDRILVFGKCEFQNCSPSFEDVKVEEMKSGYSEKFDFIQPMSVFSLKAGIGWAF